MNNIYEKIRDENKKRYGYDVSQYGKILLADLYSDRTHFIFELLQNAEDACKREYEHNKKNKKFFAQFELYPNKLVFTHNGVKFSIEDIRDICLIGRSHKVNKIGKFGIGFKSVYAFTNNPKIYSGKKSFEIKDYVHPREINPLKSNSENTTIIIEFNKEDVKSSTAYDEIYNKLLDFKIENLIFLKYLKEIKWKLYDKENSLVDSGGIYKTKIDNNFKYFNLVCLNDIRDKQKSVKFYWLLIDNQESGKNKLELAFKFDFDKNKVVPVENSKLSVFFLMELETHLKFLINGWFDPIPNRENIKKNGCNKKLIKKAAIFLSNSLDYIKEDGLLDDNFYSVLPIKFEKYSWSDKIEIHYDRFNVFFHETKKKLLNENLLLCSDGEYHSSDEVLMARNKELVELLPPKNCHNVFNKTYWINPTISIGSRNTRDIFYYYRDILGIAVKRPEDFASKITTEFLENQTDKWFIKFYVFLNGFSKQKLLIEFTDKPIIRTINNKHVKLFNKKGKVHVYFPLPDNSNVKNKFYIIKPIFISNPQVKRFFINLNVRRINQEHLIMIKIKSIFKKYKKYSEINWQENLSDLKKIIKYYKKIKEIKLKNEVLDLFMENIFFFSVNGNFQDKSMDYTIDEIYYPSEKIDIYFEGNETIRILEKRYLNDKEIEIFLKQINFKKFINVKYNSNFQHYENLNKNGHIVLYNYRGWHKRALYGFDPDFEIDGLDHALKNINYEKSRIIWSVVKKLIFTIYGTIEEATRQDYSNSREIKKFSRAGEMLMEYKWLPNDQEDFSYSKDLSLSDLPDDFEKSSIDAIKLAEILSMKNFELNDNLKKLEKDVPEIRKIFNILNSSSDEQKAEYIKILEQQKNKNDNEKDMVNMLSSKKTQRVQRVKRKTKQRVRNARKINRENKTRSVRNSQKDSKDLAKISLFEEYFDENYDTAWCQLCHNPLSECSFKTKEGKYYHGTEQIVNSEKLHSETEYPYLFLCPYCAAKYHYARTSKLLDNEDIIKKILKLKIENDNHIRIDLLQNNNSEKIYFTQKHLIGLKEIFNKKKL